MYYKMTVFDALLTSQSSIGCPHSLKARLIEAIEKETQANEGLLDLSFETLSRDTLIEYAAMNHINYQSIESLAQVLKDNNSVTCLNMNGQHMMRWGIKPLAEALKTNYSIKTLCIQDIDLQDEGAKALYEALKQNTTLCFLGNWTDGSNIQDERLIWNINNLLLRNQTIQNSNETKNQQLNQSTLSGALMGGYMSALGIGAGILGYSMAVPAIVMAGGFIGYARALQAQKSIKPIYTQSHPVKKIKYT